MQCRTLSVAQTRVPSITSCKHAACYLKMRMHALASSGTRKTRNACCWHSLRWQYLSTENYLIARGEEKGRKQKVHASTGHDTTFILIYSAVVIASSRMISYEPATSTAYNDFLLHILPSDQSSTGAGVTLKAGAEQAEHS